MPGSKGAHEDWSAEAKFATVLEAAGLSEAELSEYCRERGLYPEQIQAWREACKGGVDGDEARRREQQRQSQASRRRIRELEQEVNRKHKALAETTALKTTGVAGIGKGIFGRGGGARRPVRGWLANPLTRRA